MPPILNANVWQKLGNHFEFQHYKIFYIDLGCQDAPTVFLLHGFPTLAFDFDRLVPKLVLDFRLILPDFLDFSFSDKPSAQHNSIFEHAEMIEKLIASCKLQKCFCSPTIGATRSASNCCGAVSYQFSAISC